MGAVNTALEGVRGREAGVDFVAARVVAEELAQEDLVDGPVHRDVGAVALPLASADVVAQDVVEDLVEHQEDEPVAGAVHHEVLVVVDLLAIGASRGAVRDAQDQGVADLHLGLISHDVLIGTHKLAHDGVLAEGAEDGVLDALGGAEMSPFFVSSAHVSWTIAKIR